LNPSYQISDSIWWQQKLLSETVYAPLPIVLVFYEIWWKSSPILKKNYSYFWTIVPSGTCAKAFAHIYCTVNVEWGVKENHVAVIALHKCEKSHSQIFKLLKPLKILRMFVCRAIKHYKGLWRVEDRAWSGCPRSVTTEATIKTVQEWICPNPLWKQKIMSRELNISAQ